MIIAREIAQKPNTVQANSFARASGMSGFAYSWALSEWQRQVVGSGQWFASNKTCPVCDARHDRDLQPAINLQKMAVGSTGSACGEEGAGRRRKTSVTPVSVKQKITFDQVCA